MLPVAALAKVSPQATKRSTPATFAWGGESAR